jgi:hypothetical protein
MKASQKEDGKSSLVVVRWPPSFPEIGKLVPRFLYIFTNTAFK